MIRRLSTKWVLTVLAAVLLPFLGFAWYVNFEMKRRLWDSVEYYLLTMAGEMSARLDDEVRERERDVQMLATGSPLTEWTLGDYGGEQQVFVSTMRGGFNGFIQQSQVFDLLIAVNAQGELVVSNDRDAQGRALDPAVLERLNRDYREEAWFRGALSGQVTRVDHHKSDLLPPRHAGPGAHPANFHVGFALPVPSSDGSQQIVGVVYGLMNWEHVHEIVLRRVSRIPGRYGLDLYSTAYAWLWGVDGDTIVVHPSGDIYTKRVSQPPVNLPQLALATHASDYGMYPRYEFRGVAKTAAFKRCAGPERGGFGWVVGIGVDDHDVTTTIDELQDLLTKATALVLLIVVGGTIVIARRTTRPILELKRHTQRVAGGDLEARVDVESRDELGDLARAFNEMTAQLAQNRAQLIKAEKDAAWREMARQVAHEIKNPLTPIQLSVNLLARARKEQSPEFDAILERTIDLIQRQVANMRQIAADFSAFAGARKPNVSVFVLRELVDEVLALDAAWAAELGVRCTVDGVDARIEVDRHELRRVLINLISNALEAMPHGGTLHVTIARRRDGARALLVLEIEDSGVGLTETARARLFEPYFTTRTHGTGLGLAIAHRLIEEMGGTIALEPRGDAQGTRARIVLQESTAPRAGTGPEEGRAPLAEGAEPRASGAHPPDTAAPDADGRAR